MAESIQIPKTLNKAEKYALLLKQLKSLCDGESNAVANLANISAGLQETFDFFWVGFYLLDPAKNNLVLGPFQGPVACTRIEYGRGVCGTAWKENRTIVVEDVEKFPGHIACSALSKSEIVVPIANKNSFIGVLDIDSDKYSTFNEADKKALIEICEWIATLF